MRFLFPLDESGKLALSSYLSDTSLLVRERKRFTMILLSSVHRVPIGEIAQSCAVSDNTVKKWFNRYEAEGFSGLLDRNMNHQKSSLSAFEEDKIMDCIASNPQNLNQVAVALADQHQIKTNKNMLKRFLQKKVDLAQGEKITPRKKRWNPISVLWNRISRFDSPLPMRRNRPMVWGWEWISPQVYAWQPPQSTMSLPAQRNKAVNILGFINLENQGEFYDFEDNMTAELFIGCVEDFILKNVTKKTS
jgi:transposase